MSCHDHPGLPRRAGQWPIFAPGDHLTVVKLSPDGSEAARYPGTVIAHVAPDDWLVVGATWTHRNVELDGLAFCTGDHLVEWFSPVEYFNAFAVHAPNGQLRGWYANVTYPPWVDPTADQPVLVWRDLFVDLVGLPDGTFTIRDEDELAASGLASHDGSLRGRILRARDELVSRFERGVRPFCDVPKAAM